MNIHIDSGNITILPSQTPQVLTVSSNATSSTKEGLIGAFELRACDEAVERLSRRRRKFESDNDENL